MRQLPRVRPHRKRLLPVLGVRGRRERLPRPSGLWVMGYGLSRIAYDARGPVS